MNHHSNSCVVVGCGPRGIAVLERLTQHLTEAGRATGGTLAPRPRVVVVEAVEPGAGRIWRTDQSRWLTMNTVIGELTMAPDSPRACQVPSFQQWLAGTSEPELAALGPHDYAPRWAYGRYLHEIYDLTIRALRQVAEVVEIGGRVTGIAQHPGGYTLDVSTATERQQLEARAVVLATGHPRITPRADACEFARLAADHPDLLYLAGDTVADFDLDAVAAETPVGVIGLGLSFYDLLLSFSVGRGGEFHRDGDRLVYQPSGKEPVLYAGSRSGMPIGTRGRSQKAAEHRFSPRIFTAAALGRLRADAARRRGTAQLDFSREVLPLLLAEIELVRLQAELRRRGGADQVDRLTADLIAAGTDPGARAGVLARYGLADVAPVDPARLARPFTGRTFGSPAEFTRELHGLLEVDLEHASLGNADGPVKAGLDVIREARDLLRAAVEADGLMPGEPGADFFFDVAPWLSLVSTGPPPVRTEQLLALSRAGLVQVVGPEVQFGFDNEQGMFSICSPAVAGSLRHVSALIDTRVPRELPVGDDDLLLDQLVRDGTAGTWRPPGAERSTGLRVHSATGRVIDRSGRLSAGLYAIGIPTEGVRWFTQISNGRPDTRTAFHRDADAIALDIVRHRLSR